MQSQKKIILAKTAGFCFGVDRAVKIALDAASKFNTPVLTLGPIIHNTHMVNYLSEHGVTAINSVSEAPCGSALIIRSHGVGANVYECANRAGLNIIDATCPYVKRIHKLAESASKRDRHVIVAGDPAHPEVKGILGWCRQASVFSDTEAFEMDMENKKIDTNIPVTLLCQTTLERSVWKKLKERIKKQYTNYEVFDTICNATDSRQSEAARISKMSQAMVVAGDPMSSNTAHLAGICRKFCRSVILVGCAKEIKPGVLDGCDFVGLTAGASTPEWIIKEVLLKMSEEMKNPITEQIESETENQANPAQASLEDAETFEQMLDQSFKTINNGDKVVGTVTSITPTEVHVDLGAKHAGYIPIAEVSDDPTVKMEDVFKVNQEVETYVIRVNDVDGTIMLSKRRLDSVKGWEEVEAAQETGEALEGIVTEENKGGIVVSCKGVRVFVPASQSGLPKDSPLTALLKTRVKFRITEINRARRRVVGSIRAVMHEERLKKAEKLWQEIEVGKQYKGVVKSLKSYGAFVDIGGVDGMVHVSELSWGRIRQPSDVVSVGDEIDVFVLSFDESQDTPLDKRKISLGHRTSGTNPWNKFISEYNVGDKAHVKVVKLMPFGAFAEIIPGVDGLIHISQITDRHIGKPGEVLSEGQEVDVRITDIDLERQKISLSIRALIEDGGKTQEQQIMDAGLPDEVVAVSEPEGTTVPSDTNS